MHLLLSTPRGHIRARLVETPEDFRAGMRRYTRPVPLLFLFQGRGYHPFTMKGVPFQLDMIFLNGNRVVDSFTAPADANGPFVGQSAYDTVLELTAGDGRRHELFPGVSIDGLP